MKYALIYRKSDQIGTNDKGVYIKTELHKFDASLAVDAGPVVFVLRQLCVDAQDDEHVLSDNELVFSFEYNDAIWSQSNCIERAVESHHALCAAMSRSFPDGE